MLRLHGHRHNNIAVTGLVLGGGRCYGRMLQYRNIYATDASCTAHREYCHNLDRTSLHLTYTPNIYSATSQSSHVTCVLVKN